MLGLFIPVAWLFEFFMMDKLSRIFEIFMLNLAKYLLCVSLDKRQVNPDQISIIMKCVKVN